MSETRHHVKTHSQTDPELISSPTSEQLARPPTPHLPHLLPRDPLGMEQSVICAEQVSHSLQRHQESPLIPSSGGQATSEPLVVKSRLIPRDVYIIGTRRGNGGAFFLMVIFLQLSEQVGASPELLPTIGNRQLLLGTYRP